MATQVREAADAKSDLNGDAATPERSHSGRLMLRMPPSLHTELARAAELEHVSINAYIIGVLAGTVSWRSPDAGEMRPERMPDWARHTLMVNLVVMALLAVAAAVLVVAALVSG
jgi:hypothetical protein